MHHLQIHEVYTSDPAIFQTTVAEDEILFNLSVSYIRAEPQDSEEPLTTAGVSAKASSSWGI